jgi:predicted RNase H-like HicB family nuclease
MLYPVYVYSGDAKTAYGITLPDFEGCFAASDTLEGIPQACQQAMEAHFFEEPESVPKASKLADLKKRAKLKGGEWMFVDLDINGIQAKPIRLNVSLPSNLVKMIDAQARSRKMTRSGFLADAAMQAMA